MNEFRSGAYARSHRIFAYSRRHPELQIVARNTAALRAAQESLRRRLEPVARGFVAAGGQRSCHRRGATRLPCGAGVDR